MPTVRRPLPWLRWMITVVIMRALIPCTSTLGLRCSDLGDHWVVLAEVDVAGNSDTAWSKVTVVDQIYPTMSVSNATLYLDSSSSAVLSYADVDNSTYDNCGIDTTYLSKRAV